MNSEKISKNTYTWELEPIPVLKEAAIKYQVSLSYPQKPTLRLITFKSDDPLEQINELKQGLPATMVDALCRELEVSRKELAHISGVAERTLNRKIQEGRLSSDQSERMARVAGVLTKAAEVLGTREHAVRWLKTPRAQLKNLKPLDLTDTELGCREITNLLGRIEYGVFS